MYKTEKDISIREYNSFWVEARARALMSFTKPSELIEMLSADRDILKGKWAVLGGGCNILFTQDFDGTLIHPSGGDITVLSEDTVSALVKVDAGVEWDDFVMWSVERGLWGVENLSKIPGLTGAAPVQNLGAYGAEIKGVVESVETVAVDTLSIATIAEGHCAFGYRDSVFKRELKGKVVITAVTFRLGKKPAPNLTYGALKDEVALLGEPTLENIRKAVIKIREFKLPDPSVIGNAGSFFKNPVVPAEKAEKLKAEYPGMPAYPDEGSGMVKLSAGWLIEKAGWKGRALGPAGVYEKQALILVNLGGATGKDIIALADKVKEDVAAMFGIALENEVHIW